MTFVTDIIDKANEEGASHPTDISRRFQDQLSNILAEVIDDCADIVSAMVSSSDGMAWAQKLQGDLDPHRFAAMSSALLALADNVIRETHEGAVRDVLIQSDAGNVFIMHAGSNLLLTVFSTATNNIGMPLAHTRKGAEDIAALNLDTEKLMQ